MEDDSKHFQTRDAQLALALINAGCQYAPQNDQGPAENIYTPADMRSKGMLTKGEASIQDFEAAVTVAVQKKRKGLVTFFIVRDAVFQRAIKAWDDMAEEFEKASNENRAPVVAEIDEATAMRVAYMLRMNAERVRDIPFVRTPILSTLEGSSADIPVANRTAGVREAHAPGAKTRTTGSGAMWTLGLSDEKKRRLGIID